MNELIKVEINENDEQIVIARDLWQFLEEPYGRFDMWFNAMVEYGFVEYTDYIAYAEKTSHANGREYERKNYHLKLSMAKEICMLTKNEKGKIARKYFIEIESQWNDPFMVMARANKIQQKVISDYKEKLLEYKPAVDLYNDLMESKDTLDMGKVAKTLNFKNIGRNKLFEILRNEKILQINNEPYQEYVDRGWFKIIPSTYTDSNEITHIKTKTVVYGKGIEGISKLLFKLGFIKQNQSYDLAVS